MHASSVPPLALLILVVYMVAYEGESTHKQEVERTVFAPAERLELRDFVLQSLHPVSVPTPPSVRTTRDASWMRADTADERVLRVSREALRASALSRVRVLPALGALFCPVPGVASVSMLRALARANGARGGEHRVERLATLSEYAARDVERLLTRSDVERVLFVRHPLKRALSAFYAGRRHTDLDSAEYREFMGHVRGRTLQEKEHELQAISLLFFLTFLAAQPVAELWEPFRPVSELCAAGLLDYSFVGRLERLDTHLGALERRLRVRLRPLDAARFTSNASATARTMFGSRQRRQKAERMYGADMALLGYARAQL